MLRGHARELLRDLWRSIGRDQPFDVAATLAYFSLLALFPFFIFVLTVIGFLPLQHVDQQITFYAHRAMPHEAADLFDHTLHEVLGRSRSFLAVVSLSAGLWTASSAVGVLIGALNRAYGVRETRPFWKVKLEALAVTFIGGLLAVIAVGAMAIGPNLVHHVAAWFGLGGAFDRVWAVLRWPIVVVSMMLLLAGIYRVLPNVKQRPHMLSAGSVFAVLAWIGASMALNVYVADFNSYAKVYGTLGGVVVLLTWLYWTALVIVLGGEINAALDRTVKGIHHAEPGAAPPSPSSEPSPA
jgi:membrane protein